MTSHRNHNVLCNNCLSVLFVSLENGMENGSCFRSIGLYMLYSKCRIKIGYPSVPKFYARIFNLLWRFPWILLEHHFKTTCDRHDRSFFSQSKLGTFTPSLPKLNQWWSEKKLDPFLWIPKERDCQMIITIWSIQDSKSPVASRASQLQIPGRYPNFCCAAAAQYRVVRKGSLSSQMVAS